MSARISIGCRTPLGFGLSKGTCFDFSAYFLNLIVE
jgi:hypothetical protein